MPFIPYKQRRSNKPITKAEIETAQANTKSAAQAARYLRINYITYRKYAEMYGIFKKNQAGVGINKQNLEGHYGLDAILTNQFPHYDRTRLKGRLIAAGYMKEECARCKFAERRPKDNRVPLMLVTADGTEDLRLKNLRLLCLNCYYMTEGTLRGNMISGPLKRELHKESTAAPVSNAENSKDIGDITDADELAQMMAEIRREVHEGLTD